MLQDCKGKKLDSSDLDPPFLSFASQELRRRGSGKGLM